MLGTLSSSRPPAAMLSAIKRLLAWKLDLTHVDPNGKTILRSAGGANVRHPAGRQLYLRTIFGHRSTSFTDCPGSPTLAKARWRVTVTGSTLATARTFVGVGTRARVRWNGRTAGGATARPVVSRVFVDRAAPPAGTSTGGYAKGVWRVNNANAEQLSRSARVFASYRYGRAGDIPVVGDWDGDGTQTLGVVRPSNAAGTGPPSSPPPSGAPATRGSWAAGTATAPGRPGCCAAGAGGTSRTPSPAAGPRSAWPGRPRGPRWSATGTTGPDHRPRPVRDLRSPG